MSNTHNPTANDSSSGFHDPTSAGFTRSIEGRLLFWIAVIFSAFQIATAAHLIDFPSQVQRAFHVGFLLLLTFPLIAIQKNMLVKAVRQQLQADSQRQRAQDNDRKLSESGR